MEDKDFAVMVDGLLKDKGKFRKPEEADAYLKSYEIDNKTTIKVLECLVGDNIFRWLDFISSKLPQVASEEEFVGLLKTIILKVKGDLAQGPFIRTLIKIGEDNPNLGISLYKLMIEENDADLVLYSCFPLGGAGKKDFDKVYALVKEGLEGENPNLKTTSIKTLRVIFENETELKNKSEIFGILDRFSSENEDVNVQNEVLNAYLDFSRFNSDTCIQQLFILARRKNSVIRFNLANSLWLRNLPNKEEEIRLLEICAEDQDTNVLSRVAIALSKKGQEFPEKALSIINNWVKRGKYFEIYEIEYPIREIGKIHLDRCIKEVEKWVEEKDEDGRLGFFIPIVLTELGSNNYVQLIESVKKWPSRSIAFWKMTLKTISTFLSEIFPPKNGQECLVDSCFSILEEMAKEKNVDVEATIHGEPDKFFQCFRLIEELELERKELDFKRITQNLNDYPTVQGFLGEQWLKNMEGKKNRTHPLLILISRVGFNEEKLSKEIVELSEETNDWVRYIKSLRIRELIWPSAFLKYLEDMLKLIVSKSKELGDLRDGLRNENQFWETISEIEVISAFMRNYDVQIAPKLNGKRLDVKVQFNGETLLIEVINPEMFKPLRYLSGKALGIPNRARDKIYDEFKHHLQDLEIEEDIPVAIVIDIGRSEISFDFVEDYLMGTEQLTMLIDKKKGDIIETFPSRAADSMHTLTKETDALSAIVCYKRYLGKDGEFHTEGRIMLNKYAKNPLNPDTIDKVERVLFR